MNSSFPFRLQGVPASLGPGLRTVSGAKRSLGAKSRPSAVCAMTGESTNSLKLLLAAAVARGMPVEKWAAENGVNERTAYRWAAEPAVRAEVESIRRRALDGAIGRMAECATWAVEGIVRLGDDADSESVRLSALRALLSQYITISNYAGVEGRVAELERRFHGHASKAQPLATFDPEDEDLAEPAETPGRQATSANDGTAQKGESH